jgi:hemin uptake protein HemP
MTSEEPRFEANDSPPSQPPDRPPASFTSEELFRGSREIWIEHAGEMYRLRITSRGKLILTK